MADENISQVIIDKDSRYTKCLVYRDRQGLFLGLRPTIKWQPQSDDRFHKVNSGDRIDLLAYQYFGDCRLWWIICDYNGIRFPLDMKEGMVLRIPSQDQVFMDVLG